MPSKEFLDIFGTLGETEAKPGTRPRVMVVDDEEDVRKALQAVLEDKYSVTICKSGTEAVRAVTDDIMACIVDLRMAPMDGFQVCKILKSMHPDMPVIFHSAYQDLKTQEEISTEYGPFAYITKGEDKLVTTVTKAVEYYRGRKAHKQTKKHLDSAREQIESMRRGK